MIIRIMQVSRVLQVAIKSKLIRRRRSQIGIGIVAAILIFVLLGPLLDPYSPYAFIAKPNAPPSFQHPFGTNYLGQDVLSQIVFGAYPSLIIALIAATGATMIGFFLGVLGGYFRRLDPYINGATDVIISLPTLVILITLGTMFYPPSNLLLAALIILISWPLVARATRSQVSSLKKSLVVDVAKMNGLSDWRIAWQTIAPQVASIGAAYFVIIISYSIVIVAALEFLGVGNLSQVSWGQMLYFAQTYAFFDGDWWWILAPGALITLISSGFALIGFSVEEIMNPRLGF